MRRYTITKPLEKLPPLTPKTIKITAERTIDFVKEFNAICVKINLYNHSGATTTYRLNDENDLVNLPTTLIPEELDNVHIEQLYVNGTNADAICILAPLSLLKKFDALESG